MAVPKVIWYFPGPARDSCGVLDVDFWPTTCDVDLLPNGVAIRVGPGCVIVEVEILEPEIKGFRRVVEKVLNRFRDVDDLKVEEPSKEHLKLRAEIDYTICNEKVFALRAILSLRRMSRIWFLVRGFWTGIQSLIHSSST